MDNVRPEVTGRAVGQALSSAPMSLEDFVRVFQLPPIVPIKLACTNLGCGHSKLYKMREEGKLRIVPRGGGGSGVPVADLYALYSHAMAMV